MSAPAIKKQPNPLEKLGTWWRKTTLNLDLFDENKVEEVKKDPWYMLGGAALLFWLITIATGLFLMFYYIPTTYQAWRSVRAIFDGEYGLLVALIRNMHKYAADALIICLTLRVYRMYFRGEFKNYNQLSYMLTIVGLILAMFSGLSGYLLVWNQRALWATKVFATFPTFIDNFQDIPTIKVYFPWLADILAATLGQLQIGQTMAQLLLSGTAIGPATLTRFYSFHFMLSFVALVLVEAYFVRKGKGTKGAGGAGRLRRLNLPWFAVAMFTGMLVFISATVPVETGSPANPNVTPNPILSDWYFLGLYQMMKLWQPATATLQTILIPILAFLPVFLDANTERNMWKRPFWTMFGLWGLVLWIAFSVLICLNIADIKRDPPIIYVFSVLWLGAGAVWHWLYRAGLHRKAKAEAAAASAAIPAAGD
jgi:quinol-cytochrome oxidoreductase complex cytochrome b subunit